MLEKVSDVFGDRIARDVLPPAGFLVQPGPLEAGDGAQQALG